MQFKQKIIKQIISLSIVSIAFDTVEMRRKNRALDLSYGNRFLGIYVQLPGNYKEQFLNAGLCILILTFDDYE